VHAFVLALLIEPVEHARAAKTDNASAMHNRERRDIGASGSDMARRHHHLPDST
jgi:hypothetical protein